MRHSPLSSASAPVDGPATARERPDVVPQHVSPLARRRRWLPHLPFVLVLAAGVVLRWIDWLAYRPALLYPDSVHYLSDAVSGELNRRRPSGYSFLLGPFVSHEGIATIALGQHLLILGAGVVLYLFLLRRHVPAWGAALATVPLLLDPLQLVLEQYVLSDVLFEALLVFAGVLLLWRRRPLLVDVAAAGIVLGYAALVRGAGIGLIVPAVFAVAALRLGWRRVVVVIVAFALPVVAYMAVFDAQHGAFATNTYSERFLYGRVTTFVDCHAPLHLPRYERPLCPKLSVDRRPSSDWFMWREESPQYSLKPPSGITAPQAIHDFDKEAIRSQPVAFARIVARDFLFGFHPSRTHSVPGFPASRWLFHRYYWSLDGTEKAADYFRRSGYGPLVAERPYSSFLTSFQDTFHTPGPLLFLAALVAAVASAGVGHARWSGKRVACGLLLGLCLVPLLTTAALSGFSWRYQLPQLALIGPAAALGITALVGRSRSHVVAAEQTALRRLTKSMVPRRSSDAELRRAESWFGVVAAVLVGGFFAAAAFASGWAAMGTAGVIGLVVAALTAVLLFASRWRGMPAHTKLEDHLTPADARRPDDTHR
jgi:hypothetical protein